MIDRGSLEQVITNPIIDKTSFKTLINASGNTMDIVGTFSCEVTVSNFHFKQQFQVLNAKTYKHILLGSDFLSNFTTLEFDLLFTKLT